MRPIERGDIPRDKDGKPKVFAEHANAKPDLIRRLGQYCSYCEMRIPAGLAVEHIKPKSRYPGLALTWSNFLLSCINCNSIKGSQDINLDDYYWPDRDNTARAIKYLSGGRVQVNSEILGAAEQERARRTIELTGLDRKFDNNPTASNLRWNNRREAWDIAVRSLQRLEKNNYPDMREKIVEHAQDNGFWSVWMTVFQDDTDMLKRFIKAFPGTCQACFDADLAAVPRPGGAI
jgi:uncharacterized protein (TIGR02646 family)